MDKDEAIRKCVAARDGMRVFDVGAEEETRHGSLNEAKQKVRSIVRKASTPEKPAISVSGQGVIGKVRSHLRLLKEQELAKREAEKAAKKQQEVQDAA
jgi:hypothetical protein